ncbi:MAG TPA: DUF3180 domain-containing protein [Kineosporiaceae bacterium]|nr:DUF3180 domain-containing protein [Kineosporiaceae bacterium]
MTPARPLTLAVLAVLATGLTWLGLDLWSSRGGLTPPLPWATLLFLVALVGAVISAGLPVRRWVSGRRERALNPLVAARTVVLAKAAAYGGALLTGWYAGQALALLPELVEVRRARLLLAAGCAVAAIGLAAAGLVVQRWCRVPPPDDDHDGSDRGKR